MFTNWCIHFTIPTLFYRQFCPENFGFHFINSFSYSWLCINIPQEFISLVKNVLPIPRKLVTLCYYLPITGHTRWHSQSSWLFNMQPYEAHALCTRISSQHFVLRKTDFEKKTMTEVHLVYKIIDQTVIWPAQSLLCLDLPHHQLKQSFTNKSICCNIIYESSHWLGYSLLNVLRLLQTTKRMHVY